MQIRTDRLILREITLDDWPAVLAYQRDPQYLRYYAWTEDRSEDDVRAFVKMLADLQHQQPRRKFQLAITLPGDDALIGNCGIRRKDGKDFEADIGYELSPAHWGRGYATEAARAMVAYGFEELKMHRVSSWCIADNVASARVLEKAGLRPEGRLRLNEHFKDRYWDTLLFGVLREEWQAASR
ncbi:MAG: GNAT family protein [Dehalococcoidia bacterium]